MAEVKFKPGDVVKLKSGSPDLTVEEVMGNGLITCVWFETDDFKSRNLWPSSLVKVPEVSD